NADCDLVIADKSVSRAHAAITKIEDQHVLQDLGSSNGTFLNGLRLVTAHTFALRGGDVIEIGPARLTYGTRPPAGDGAADPAETDALPDRSYP
ncbi:FHA domain-containing protein, partial [Staphylococcus aureus]